MAREEIRVMEQKTELGKIVLNDITRLISSSDKYLSDYLNNLRLSGFVLKKEIEMFGKTSYIYEKHHNDEYETKEVIKITKKSNSN